MSSWIALGDFVEIITVRIDPLIVALVASVPAVATYAVGQKLAAFVERLTGPALAMFFPHAAALSASGDEDAIRRTMVSGTRLAVSITLPLALVVSVLAAPALQAWVGSGFDDAAAVVTFLSLTTLVVSFSRVGVYILRGLGNVRFAALIGVFEAIVNLGASVYLGHRMGVSGVALGTLIGVTLNHLFILLPYTCSRLGVPLLTLTFALLRAHLLPVAASLAVGIALRPFAFDGIPQLGVAGAAVVVVYAGLFAVTGMTRHERDTLRRAVAKKLPGRSVG
jgi:O-antigen/teichoic acid export membrane protein